MPQLSVGLIGKNLTIFYSTFSPRLCLQRPGPKGGTSSNQPTGPALLSTCAVGFYNYQQFVHSTVCNKIVKIIFGFSFSSFPNFYCYNFYLIFFFLTVDMLRQN
jgi:hypothetical protein